MTPVREIISLVALNFGVSPQELLSDSRREQVVLPRMVAMYLASKHTPQSSSAIGRVFDRDRTTVVHNVDRIETEIRADRKLKALIEALGRSIELRERLEALGGINVLAVAQRIAANPARMAMGASVMEVAALAATVVDLWEASTTAEAAIEAATSELTNDEEEAKAREDLADALLRAFADQMAVIRGEPINQENEDGSSHS